MSTIMAIIGFLYTAILLVAVQQEKSHAGTAEGVGKPVNAEQA